MAKIKIPKRNKKDKGERISLAKVIKAELPAAISSNITPLLAIGGAALLASVIMLFIPAFRSVSPFFLSLGLIITGYAIWLKANVVRNGYDEHIFKVVDYTYIVPILVRRRSPTGILLLKTDEKADTKDGNMYHVAVSGRTSNLPPIDWIIRVYVPKGMKASQYGDRKYFPTVYGYRIEGEDK